MKATPLDRFLEKVERLPNGCWSWTGHINGATGYGSFSIHGRHGYAHRWSYEYYVGPIPDGFHVDHLCRNRACVNPDHLDAVTQQENLARGQGGTNHRSVTHCPRGHEYKPENTYVWRGKRHCRACHHIRNEEYRERRRQARAALRSSEVQP